MKTVTVTKTQICAVQTLSEWLDQRIIQIRKADAFIPQDQAALSGRLAELEIIREKIDDGRIQKIGKTQFKGAKS